jgi:hypothetical protein
MRRAYLLNCIDHMKTNHSFSPFRKSIISPFITIGFLAISITGILLFFHIKNGMIMTIHQWFGWAFIVGGLIHLLLHFKTLLSHLKTVRGLLSVGLSLVLLIAMAMIGVNHRGHGHGHGEGRANYEQRGHH